MLQQQARATLARARLSRTLLRRSESLIFVNYEIWPPEAALGRLGWQNDWGNVPRLWGRAFLTLISLCGDIPGTFSVWTVAPGCFSNIAATAEISRGLRRGLCHTASPGNFCSIKDIVSIRPWGDRQW